MRIKFLRTLVALGIVVGAASPGFAQKSKADMTTEINANLSDNSMGAVTPAIVRSTLIDMVNSYQQYGGSSIGTLVTVTDGTQGNPPTDTSAIIFDLYTDLANVATGFSSAQGFNNQFVWAYGDHSSGFNAPNGKTTLSGIKNFTWGPAAGQKLAQWHVQYCPGSGDCLGPSLQQTYEGGMLASGDEGSQGYNAAISQPNTSVGMVLGSSAVVGGGNTTSTQPITGSYIAQTITVTSSAGFTVGEWVNVNQGNNPGSISGGLSEAVQLTAVATGTLTGAFRLSQSNGVTIKPAIVLTMPYNGNLGQHRFMVNLSTTSYSTGTIAWTPANAQPVGSGTTWTNAMVGGDAGRPGCIAATADTNITGVGIKSWFSIATVSSNTAIVTQPARSYDLSSSSAAYIIRPCAYILRVIPPRSGNGTATVILENNAFTWTSGDSVDYAIGPSMGTVGNKLDTYTYMPNSNVVGFQHTEYGPVAPLKWVNLVNIAGTAPSISGANQSYFIFADSSGSPGGVNMFLRAQKVSQFASVSIANGGTYLLTPYGLVQNGLIENVAMPKGNGGQGAGIEHDPVWNHNSVHEGITVDATDTLSNSASLLFAGKISGTAQFSIRKDGAGQMLGGLSVGLATFPGVGVVNMKPQAFASLAACAAGIEGSMAAVTDSSTAVWGATITGASTNHVQAYCDGTNWTVAGK